MRYLEASQSSDFPTLVWLARAFAHTIAHDQPEMRTHLEAVWEEVEFERSLDGSER